MERERGKRSSAERKSGGRRRGLECNVESGEERRGGETAEKRRGKERKERRVKERWETKGKERTGEERK